MMLLKKRTHYAEKHKAKKYYIETNYIKSINLFRDEEISIRFIFAY